MAKNSIWLVFGLFSAAAQATCLSDNSKFHFQSNSYDSTSSECYLYYAGDSMMDEVINGKEYLAPDRKADKAKYWSDWVFKSKNSPLLTQQVSDSYFGIGVWMPDEIERERNDLSTEEYLMSHGVQFSVGIGDKKPGEPRMRLDYLWHSETSDSWSMQIEVPF